MAGEQLSKGVTLAAGDGGTTEVFTAIPGIVGIPAFPNLVVPKVSVTALDSAGEEFIPGIGTAGDVSFTINLRLATPTSTDYLPSQTVLRGWLNDGLLHNFRLTFPGTVTKKRTFTAFVSKWQEAATGPNNALQSAITLTVSGVPVTA